MTHRAPAHEGFCDGRGPIAGLQPRMEKRESCLC